MRRSDAGLVRFAALSAWLVLAGSLSAQAPTPTDSLPRLTIRRGEGLVGLLRDADVRIAVDRDAYVAVFALTPGSVAAPIQVLAPSAPQETALLRGGKSYSIRPLAGRGLVQLADARRLPLLVAFVSLVRPNLGAFGEGTRWSTELVVADSAIRDTPALVTAIARELYGDLPYREVFGTDVPYRVVTERATDALRLTPKALAAMSAGFESDCLTKVATLSYETAVTRATEDQSQRPLGMSGGICGGIGVDWPVALTKVYPEIGAPSALPSAQTSASGSPTPAAPAGGAARVP